MTTMFDCKHKAATYKEISLLITQEKADEEALSKLDNNNNSNGSNGSNNYNNISLTMLLLHGSWNTALTHKNNNTHTHTHTNTNTHTIYGSSNEEEDAMKIHRCTISKWLSKIVSKAPSCISSSLSSTTHEVLSVQVDQDDDTMDICISDNIFNPISNAKDVAADVADTDVADTNGYVNMLSLDDDVNGDTNGNSENELPALKAPADLPALILVVKSTSKHTTSPKIVHINFNHVQLTHCLLNFDESPYLNELLSEIENNITSSIDSIRKLQSTLSNHDGLTPHHVDDSNKTQESNIINNDDIKNDTNNNSNNDINNNTIHEKPKAKQQLRIFVAGDKSQVGKSSICLGLIGTLLTKYNYHPSSLAYIKPATQCEESQLIAKYCEEHHIENRPVGPLVYYRGFTRAFLNGTTDDSETLLRHIKQAVDDISRDKDIVIIDGVGYPAVGSICGTDNVNVALACGYDDVDNNGNGNGKSIPPAVLIVGKRGVGDAIDSYNLNATYFKAKNVKVMGAIFNRLPNDSSHFYSLENCKTAVSSYFKKQKLEYGKDEEVFGFIPEVEGLSSSSLEGADQFIDIFSKHVDVPKMLERAVEMRNHEYGGSLSSKDGIKILDKISNGNSNNDTNDEMHVKKKMKLSSPSQGNNSQEATNKMNGSTTSNYFKLSRDQIENAAKIQGAAGG